MKKWILSITLIALLLCTSVMAQENTLAVTDAAAEAGKTVFLTVRLNQSVVGDTIAIKYEFDSAYLTAIPGSCKWEKSSPLPHFDNKNNGVWAAPQDAVDLKGDICTLAFRINSGVSFESTKVSCTVMVKNGAEEVGTYTAAAMVSMSCKHSTYGDWARKDDLIHTSTCTQCGNVQSGTHKWDAGVLSENPDDTFSKLLTLTCQACKGTKVIVVADSLSEPDGTKPTEDSVTGSTEPNHGQTHATSPNGGNGSEDSSNDDSQIDPTSPNGGSESEKPSNSESDPQQTYPGHTEVTEPSYDHDYSESETLPNSNTDNSGQTDHGHTHEDEEDLSDSTNQAVGIVVFLVAAGLVTGGVIFVMKKK